MPGRPKTFTEWGIGYADEHRRLKGRIDYRYKHHRPKMSPEEWEKYIAEYIRFEEAFILYKLAHLKPTYDKKLAEREAASKRAAEERRHQEEQWQRDYEERQRKQQEKEREERNRRRQQQQQEYQDNSSRSQYSYRSSGSSYSYQTYDGSSGQRHSYSGHYYQSYRNSNGYGQNQHNSQQQERTDAQRKENERKQKAEQEQRRIQKRFTEYQNVWNSLRDRPGQLRFLTIPWPVLAEPTSPEVVTVQNVRAFFNHPTFLAPNHWESKKKHVQKELLRWHTDKFRSMTLSRVCAEDKEKVGKLAEMVVRVLNDIKSQC